MIEVTFYRDGFEINGHAVPEICYQVSILAWAFSNLVMDSRMGNWYTADYDNSNAGYTHFTYDSSEGNGERIINRLKAYLEVWGEYYGWQNGNVRILEKDGDLIIPENFKEIKGLTEVMK